MRKFLKNTCGFSLIELSIVLIIVGLLIAPIFAITSSFFSPQKKTKEKIAELNAHLINYAQINARLPCPSSLSSDGEEKCDEKIFNVQDLESSSEGDTVFGIIPYRELGLSKNRVLDYWGNPIYYAVAKNLTLNRVNYSKGSIKLINSEGKAVSEKSLAKYILISYGSNNPYSHLLEDSKTGSKTFSFTNIERDQKCKSLKKKEQENCDFDSIFTLSSLFESDEYYYDDIVVPTVLIESFDTHLSEGCFIIGRENPRDKEKQHFYIRHGHYFEICESSNEASCEQYICEYGEAVKNHMKIFQ